MPFWPDARSNSAVGRGRRSENPQRVASVHVQVELCSLFNHHALGTSLVRRPAAGYAQHHGASSGEADRSCLRQYFEVLCRLGGQIVAYRCTASHHLFHPLPRRRQMCQNWEDQPTILVAPTENVIGDLHAAYQVESAHVSGSFFYTWCGWPVCRPTIHPHFPRP